MMRDILCISLDFPPSSLAGVHRMRHLAKHLPRHGWRPTVVCLDERDVVGPLDWRLAELAPADASVQKIRALPLKWTRRIGIGDTGLRALWSLRGKLRALARQQRFDAIMMTGFPFYPMLLAPFARRLFGAPVLLDFQDPWVSAWGAKQALSSKNGLSHALAAQLEPRVLRGADFITSVSETQNEEMAERYPWLVRERMAAIPIGGDPDDFGALAGATAKSSALELDPSRVNLSYVGTCLPRSGALLRALFRAFARLRQSAPALAATVRLNFIGTSNQPDDRTPRVLPTAEGEGVADSVFEEPRRIPYLDALSVLASSNGLLLIGSDERHYTASKIYPALMSGRPFLSLFHQASSAHAILSDAGGGVALSFGHPDELVGMEHALADALRALIATPDIFPAANPKAYEPYLAASVAGRYAQIFNRLAAEPFAQSGAVVSSRRKVAASPVLRRS